MRKHILLLLIILLAPGICGAVVYPVVVGWPGTGTGTDDQTASEVPVITNNFGGHLANDATSDTVQKCLDLLDDITTSASGDVTGPEGATAGNIPVLDATGKVLSDSGTKPGDFLAVETDPTVDLTKLQTLVSNDFHNLGGTETANAVSTSTGGFAGILSTADTTIQAALDTLDDHNHSNFSYSSSLSTNMSYSGTIDTLTVGESVSFGQLLFHNLVDGKWYLATGGATAAELPVEAMSLGSATDGNPVTGIRTGYVRNDAWSWTVNGTRKMLYVSTATSGAITEDPATVTAGQYTQTIGTINSATTIFFNPGIYFQKAN